MKLTRGQIVCLQYLNSAAAMLHLAIFIVVAAEGDTDFRPPLVGVQSEGRSQGGSAGSGSGSATLTSFGSFPITALVITYPAVTFFAHLCNVLIWPDFYVACLERCENPLRWFEYAITASIMSAVISFLTGVRSALLLVAIATIVASTMACGYSAEQTNHPAPRADAWQNPSYLSRIRTTLLGFVPYVAEWSITIVTMRDLSDCGSGAIVGIVSAEFPLWTLFAVVQLVQFYLPPSYFVYGEYAFIVLSLTAKAVLAIFALAAGYLSRDAVYC